MNQYLFGGIVCALMSYIVLSTCLAKPVPDLTGLMIRISSGLVSFFCFSMVAIKPMKK